MMTESDAHEPQALQTTGLERVLRYAVFVVAVLWSGFQVMVAGWVILDSAYIRSIHLGFALLLAFLTAPAFKTRLLGLKTLSSSPWMLRLNMLTALVASLSALMLVIDYAGITARTGAPIARDLWLGCILVILLLEACRRSVGPALPVIALTFCAYAFFGPYMPSGLAFKGVSLNRFMGQMTMSTEGIYGVPLRVSAMIVFLFVLFGAMLDRAGGGKFFIDLALSLLGRFKGGPAKAAVLSSGLTGMISGSSIANIVTTGTFTIPMMKKVGYPSVKAAAIEVAASTDGQLAPPIMGAAAFIIAEYVNVPYIDVVKAALIPAFASYAALMFITHIEADKLGLKGIPASRLPRFLQVLKRGGHFLIPLAFLIHQLVIERRTPERAALYSVVVMAAIMLIQQCVKQVSTGGNIARGLRDGVVDILVSFRNGAVNMIPVALATAGAGIIVGVVSMGPGGMITSAVCNLSHGNIFLLLTITAVASLIIGMGLPTTATYITMASLIAPAIVIVANNQEFLIPIMAAHLFCFYFGILADDTPPVGLAAYAASAIAHSPPIKTGIQGFTYDLRTSIIAFMFMFNTDIILHNIHSLPIALLVGGMTTAGAFAFASATQGWLIAPNRWHHFLLLLAASFVLFQPGVVAGFAGANQQARYWFYPLGLALFGMVYVLQKMRRSPGTEKD